MYLSKVKKNIKQMQLFRFKKPKQSNYSYKLYEVAIYLTCWEFFISALIFWATVLSSETCCLSGWLLPLPFGDGSLF